MPMGDVLRVWIWPDGQVTEVPAGEDWLYRPVFPLGKRYHVLAAASTPGQRVQAFRVANRLGYYQGAVLNGRLYVTYGENPPGTKLRKLLRAYAADKRLDRGIAIEKYQAGHRPPTSQ